MYQATPRRILDVVTKSGAAVLALIFVVGMINRLWVHDAYPRAFGVLSAVGGFVFLTGLILLGVGLVRDYRRRNSADQ